jgi:hypothetical protein
MAKSTDRGSTWIVNYIATDTAAGLYSVSALRDTLVLHYKQTRNGYDVKSSMIYSTDGGVSWNLRPDTLDDNSEMILTTGTLHLIQTLPTNSAFGSAPEIIYQRSFDLGDTWRNRDTLSSVDGEFAHEMDSDASTVTPERVLVAWRDGVECAAFVGCTIIERQSKSNGAGWMDTETLTDTPRGAEPAVSIGPTGFRAVVWTDETSEFHVVIRMMASDSAKWCPIVDLTPSPRGGGLPDVVVSGKAVHVVWSEYFPGPPGSYRIIYRRGRFFDTDVQTEPQTIPLFAELFQNYPNPFNPSTSIVYRLERQGFVSLRVFDILGREIETLVNEEAEAGEYNVNWEAGPLSAGVYFYRLSVDGVRQQVKSAILVR